MVILVDSFISKYYKKYTDFNVCYGNGSKRYASGIPYFLNNCPRKIVEILFKKIYRVVPKAEINGQDQHKFKVYHNEEVTGIGETMKCF